MLTVLSFGMFDDCFVGGWFVILGLGLISFRFVVLFV